MVNRLCSEASIQDPGGSRSMNARVREVKEDHGEQEEYVRQSVRKRYLDEMNQVINVKE